MKIIDGVLDLPTSDPWDKSILYEMPHFKYCRSKLNPVFIAVYCSRNDNLKDCMDRLEGHENTHARHMVIGKDGRFVQYAAFNDAIKHIRGKSPINNSNTIAIELACNGRLIRQGSSSSFVASTGKMHYSQSVKIKNGVGYDKCTYAQTKTLTDIMRALYYEYGYLELVDGGIFRNSNEYKIFPILNLEKEMKNEL